MGTSLDELLTMMLENTASDLILKVGAPPSFRVNGALVKSDVPPLTAEETAGFAGQILNEEQQENLKRDREEDVSYVLPECEERFRANVFYQQNFLGLVFRAIKKKIPSFEELTLPSILYNITGLSRGLVLITGTTGSGKSSTMAALVEHINNTQTKHIVTIEDPIEFTYRDNQSIVTQREVGMDTKSFSSALVAAMRQNPDVILVGEMRDAETMDAGIAAAETGHLVLSTMHTIDAAQTLNRILEFYPKTYHDAIRMQLAEYLMVTISQRLIPAVNGGMVPAVEIMLQNPVIKKLIYQNRIDKMKSVIHQSRQEGMQTFDQSLVELHQAGYITFEEGAARCSKPSNFKLYLEGHFPDVDAGIIGSL